MRHRVAVDRKRIGDALDADVEIESVVVRVVGLDAEVADARVNGRFERGVIRHIRIAALLDVADQAGVNLGGLDVGVAVSGANADRGLVLACVVDHLPSEGGQAVDRETRAAL